MSLKKILVTYSIERVPFSKSRYQRSLLTDIETPQYDMTAIRERLSSLHDKDARIVVTNIDDEKDIQSNLLL